MIRPSELRIGNWVTSKHGYDMEVTTVSKYKDLGLDTDFSKPIPLTEEWFERFGFKLEKWYISGNKAFEYKLRDFTISKLELELGVFMVNTKQRASIKYVHQLQNLYFALVGEELKLAE